MAGEEQDQEGEEEDLVLKRKIAFVGKLLVEKVGHGYQENQCDVLVKLSFFVGGGMTGVWGKDIN